VEGHDVDEYCSLLAKVALQNNGYVLANHFTNSFTLKRITMMKTVRRKIKNWKVVAAALTLPLFFFVVACQDQVVEDLNLVAKNSSISLSYPKEVQDELDRSKATYPPGTEFYVLEMNEEGKQKMKQLTKEMNTRSLEGRMITVNDDKEERNFFIYKKDSQTNQINNLTATDDGVFSVVEESAQPMGGMTEFYKVIASEIKYPAEARAKGIEGRVFVEFIVDTDGSVYGAHVLKGIGAGCDEEAARVVALSAAWIPGKQSGQIIKQRMVIPIIFKLDGSGKIIEPDQNTNSTLGELSVTAYPKKN
jgi:TonB family protein